MVRDEAPAATICGFNGKGKLTAPISIQRQAPARFSRCGPISLVAAEIHLGHRPAGICDGWLHCNIQVACHAAAPAISKQFNEL
jgi:hypothetical protein